MSNKIIKLIKDKRLLRAMAKANCILWPTNNGDKFAYAHEVKDFRVYKAESVGNYSPYCNNIGKCFWHRKKKYALRYVDGCFYQFVFEINETK